MKYQDKRCCASAKGLCLSIEQDLGLHASVPLRGGVQNTSLGMREQERFICLLLVARNHSGMGVMLQVFVR